MSQAAEIERRHPTPVRFTAREAARLVARATAVDAVGLEERAAKFRADCEKSFHYDIGYYFKMVDKELARPPIGR